MKCPTCGQWNRASLPRCIRCGTPLQTPQDQPPEWMEEIGQQIKQPTTFVERDEDGEKAARDPRDELAIEMDSLRIRHSVGDQKQFELRRDLQNSEYNQPRRRISVYSERDNIITRTRNDQPADEYEQDAPPEQSSKRYYRESMNSRGHDARRVYSARSIRMTRRNLRGRSKMGYRRYIRLALIPICLVCAVLALKHFVVDPQRAALSESQSYAVSDFDCLLMALGLKEFESAPEVMIYPSILHDMAAHTIEIPGTDGARIMVRETKSTYVVIGGYATIEIPDYFWYENETGDLGETMDVTLTPYLVESAGKQKPLAKISYRIDVPLSPITMVTPASSYQEVATTTYKVSFIVNKGSQVTINGDDYSDLVNTQNGVINYNASVKPVGENYVTIEVRSQYYRKSTTVITLYREVQDIPIDLMTTISDESNYDYMTIRGTTLPGETKLTVLSPHRTLDTSSLAANGSFSFIALFSRVGTNTIEIQAEHPGLETSVIRFNVYYLPFADAYTTKAWGLDASTAGRANYDEFLANTERRVKDAQIYQCIGTLVETLSEAPQLMIMECGTAENTLRVLLENQSDTTWELGKKYKIFADAFGKYNGIPRLTARYTYTMQSE